MRSWWSAPIVIGAFAALVWLEWRRPLRSQVEPKLTRTARNLTVAVISAVAVLLMEAPVALGLAALVERHDVGLLNLVQLPAWLKTILAIVLLDYTLYLWHVLTHKVPLLWRFHLVHHVDLDLDASTALRFHFGELAVSVPWRMAQVIVIGVSPLSYLTWQFFVFLSILFHHSNVELPIRLEKWINRLFVTPRMHGIHHSMVREETDSNWSSGLTLWDRLHGTLRLNVPQREVTIGVPAYRKAEDVELLKILLMPFRKQRSSWQLPDNGEPRRERLPLSSGNLLP